MFTLPDANIVGGVVRRRFTSGGDSHEAGKELTREQLLSMPIVNRNSLVESHFIEIFRMPGDFKQRVVEFTPVAPQGNVPTERVVVEFGDSKAPKRYYVVEGVRINKKLLTAEEATALAVTASEPTEN